MRKSLGHFYMPLSRINALLQLRKTPKLKKSVPFNIPEHKDIRSFFGNAATRQLKSVTKNSKEVETICID